MGEDELVDLFVSFLPETVEGWLAAAVLACLVLSLALPAPRPDCHPVWKIGHKLICMIGLGASRLRGAGRIGKIGKLFRRKR